ncbi:prenyltransferase/squalene oxidase repeat-containing protein [Nonomuraea sp. NPDC003804]|uniref:prenyltransferase/squalene oxidase repeat-containing protein n=1 Tax=Nonomuraea sp. NPDC003804 TaxID=3154547 RepID=UPI0033B3F1A5
MSITAQGVPETIPAADALLTDLMRRPWGQVSPSVYETGRLVTLAPWLVGHEERLAFLVATQRPDGSWGAPDGYGLVPTLSATEAILSALLRDGHGAPGADRHRLESEDGDRHGLEGAERHGLEGADRYSLGEADRHRLEEAARRGLRALADCLGARRELPDMPAIEHIVPSLVALINQHVQALPGQPPLPLPDDMSYDTLALIRSWIAAGTEVPEKLLHALEIAGPAASGAPAVAPTAIGTVGASPAATAAWLGERGWRDADDPARGHLEALARRHGGPVPVGVPITVFERGWVLSWLIRAGVPIDVPPEMVADLRAAIGPAGTPAGPGLPADADTTSVALYALSLLGAPYEPDSLWAFHSGTHFSTWPGEQGSSVSVNAHVLDAFGQYVARRPAAADRYGAAITGTAEWIRDRQRPDGSWDDRWHASPYYATASCALALDEFGGEESAAAVRAAADWVLDGQRADGSWGRWEGTAEETAYAMMTLLLTGPRGSDPRRAEAAARGHAHLVRSAGADHPPLWHDKDLYTPVAVVRAAVLASSYLAQQAC